MAYQRVPETAEITVHQTLYGNNIVNTFHAERPAGYSLADVQVLAARIDALAVPVLLATQSISLAYVRTDVRGLNAENDLSASDNTNAGTGGAGVRALAPQIAFCVTRKSGLTGRSARGRVYVSGIPFDSTWFDASTGKTLLAARCDAYKNAVDTFRTVIDGTTGWRAVIVSRYHNGAKRAEGVPFIWTTSSYTDRKLDTVRGRVST